MSYKHSRTVFTTKQISNMIENQEIVFDNAVQRGFVWSKAQKSLLIHSIILDIPIPDVFAVNNNDVYDILDGKQRLNTISQYIRDSFSLLEYPPIKMKSEEINISKLKFSELPEKLQDKILDYTIEFVVFNKITKNEFREMFLRLNNGKPLSSKSKAVAYCLDIEHLLKIGEHEIFRKIVSLKGINNKDQAAIIMKCYLMINENINNVNFMAKKFYPEMEKTVVSKEDEKKLNNIFDYSLDVYNCLIKCKQKRLARRVYREIHFVSLTPFFKYAVDRKMDAKDFSQFIINFYDSADGISIDEEYNLGSTNGTSNPTRIKSRNNALNRAWNDFIKKF